MTSAVLPYDASRLLAELMPIAITVGGAGAAGFAQALAEQGADVEILTAQTQPGFDLGVLLADRAAPGPATPAEIAALAAVSERLLLVPSPGVLPETDAWFEALAEHGYQPVVEYDASFLGRGAFLVDRNATAAEGELAAFAERISGVPAAAAIPPPAVEDASEALKEAVAASDALKAVVAALDSEIAAQQAALQASAQRIAALQTQLDALEAENHQLRNDNAAWERLRHWVRAVCARQTFNTLSALRASTGAPRGSRLRRLFGLRDVPSAEESAILANLRILRECELFDANWYIASYPAVAQSGIDPVLHYLLTGAAAGAEPGPWFDTAAYKASTPGVVGNPLLHAIATKAVPRLLAAAGGAAFQK